MAHPIEGQRCCCSRKKIDFLSYKHIDVAIRQGLTGCADQQVAQKDDVENNFPFVSWYNL